MIGYLKGSVLTHLQKTLLLDVQGVGYEIHVSERVIGIALPTQDVELFIYTHVREDSLQLFGFPSLQERKMFELLLSVNGVGPKSALEITNMPVETLTQAIMMDDVLLLTRVPGIGKRTAERIIIDLRGKIEQLPQATTVSSNTSMDAPEQPQSQYASMSNPVFLDIMEGLLQLGYDKRNIIDVLNTLKLEDVQERSEEEILKYCLQRL